MNDDDNLPPFGRKTHDFRPNEVVVPIDFQGAMNNAARVLQIAEMTTDLALMERLERIADSWLTMAQILKP